jgi:hypothetical protein
MWSTIVRSCPPCDNLLQHLQDNNPLHPPFHNLGAPVLHNVLQWLKVNLNRDYFVGICTLIHASERS